MPVTDGTYEELTADEIRSVIELEIREQLGEHLPEGQTPDLSQFSVLWTLANIVAETDAELVEPSIQAVYDSAFLESAEDESLENVVALLGFQRQSAVPATGYIRFLSSEPVRSSYVIQSGTAIETDSQDPVRFETTEAAPLPYLDGFESGNLNDYSGDTGSFTVQQSVAYRGDDAVEATASGTILGGNGDSTFRGLRLSTRQNVESGGVGGTVYCAADADNYYRTVLDQSASELRIEVVSGGTVDSSSTTSVSIPTGEWTRCTTRVGVQSTLEATLYDESGTELDAVTHDDTTYDSGMFGVYSSSATFYVDELSSDFTTANIRAVEGGAQTNVGENTLSILPSIPNGVDAVANPIATGNTDYVDRTGIRLTRGEAEETDSELRERVQQTVTSGGGAATVDAIRSELVNNVDGVSSVRLFENDTDSTDANGLPSFSFEAVVLGGTDIDVARAIFDSKAVTAQDYGGARGTGVTETVQAENGQQYDISFTRPTSVDVDLTIDVEAYDTYVGDTEVRNAIVDYVGGTRSDGTSLVGTGVGEDVYISQVEDIVVGPEDTGIRSVTNISTTPSITQNSNGADIISIGANEVAETDGSDGSIVLNVTTVSN